MRGGDAGDAGVGMAGPALDQEIADGAEGGEEPLQPPGDRRPCIARSRCHRRRLEAFFSVIAANRAQEEEDTG